MKELETAVTVFLPNGEVRHFYTSDLAEDNGQVVGAIRFDAERDGFTVVFDDKGREGDTEYYRGMPFIVKQWEVK